MDERELFSAESVRRQLPDDDTLYDLASLFKMFGDPTRAKILSCLQLRDMYVGELAETLKMTDSAVSSSAARAARGKTREGREGRQGSALFP